MERKHRKCERCRELVVSRLGIGRAQVLPHSNLLVVFAKQLLADCVAVLGDDADEPVDVLGMVSNELRELLHLRFEMF